MADRKMLITEKRPMSEERAKRLRERLEALGVDSYQAHALSGGYGPALFGHGELSELLPIAEALNDFGLRSALLDRRPKGEPPQEVKGFEFNGNRIIFTTRQGKVEANLSGTILAVFATLGGNLKSKLIASATLNPDNPAVLSDEDKYDEILMDKPVLDLYFIPERESSDPLRPFRLLPGKFNADGLGDEKELSGVRNLSHFIMRVRRHAQRFILHMDFGLSELPGVRLDTRSGMAAIESSLKSLSIYGQYLLALHRQSGGERRSIEEPIPVITGGIQSSLQSQVEFTPSSLELLPPPPMGLSRSPLTFVLNGSQLKRIGILLSVLIPVVFAIFASESLQFFLLQRGGLMLIFSAIAAYASYRALKLRRIIADTPTSKARSAAMGMVEMKGIAHRAHNLLSPLSQLPCIRYKISRYRRHYKEGKSTWVLTNVSESGPVPFYLQDDTGRVLIDPQGADSRYKHRHEYASNVPGLGALGWTLESDTKVVEETIPELATLYILGWAEPITPEIVPLSRRVAMKLRKLKRNPLAMSSYDASNDGVIDDVEYAAARKDMERRAEREALAEQNKADENAPKAKIRKPQHGGPFVIREGEEEKVSFNYGAQTVLYFVVALGLLIGGLSQLLGAN